MTTEFVNKLEEARKDDGQLSQEELTKFLNTKGIKTELWKKETASELNNLEDSKKQELRSITLSTLREVCPDCNFAEQYKQNDPLASALISMLYAIDTGTLLYADKVNSGVSGINSGGKFNAQEYCQYLEAQADASNTNKSSSSNNNGTAVAVYDAKEKATAEGGVAGGGTGGTTYQTANTTNNNGATVAEGGTRGVANYAYGSTIDITITENKPEWAKYQAEYQTSTVINKKNISEDQYIAQKIYEAHPKTDKEADKDYIKRLYTKQDPGTKQQFEVSELKRILEANPPKSTIDQLPIKKADRVKQNNQIKTPEIPSTPTITLPYENPNPTTQEKKLDKESTDLVKTLTDPEPAESRIALATAQKTKETLDQILSNDSNMNNDQAIKQAITASNKTIDAQIKQANKAKNLITSDEQDTKITEAQEDFAQANKRYVDKTIQKNTDTMYASLAQQQARVNQLQTAYDARSGELTNAQTTLQNAQDNLKTATKTKDKLTYYTQQGNALNTIQMVQNQKLGLETLQGDVLARHYQDHITIIDGLLEPIDKQISIATQSKDKLITKHQDYTQKVDQAVSDYNTINGSEDYDMDAMLQKYNVKITFPKDMDAAIKKDLVKQMLAPIITEYAHQYTLESARIYAQVTGASIDTSTLTDMTSPGAAQALYEQMSDPNHIEAGETTNLNAQLKQYKEAQQELNDQKNTLDTSVKYIHALVDQKIYEQVYDRELENLTSNVSQYLLMKQAHDRHTLYTQAFTNIGTTGSATTIADADNQQRKRTEANGTYTFTNQANIEDTFTIQKTNATDFMINGVAYSEPSESKSFNTQKKALEDKIDNSLNKAYEHRGKDIGLNTIYGSTATLDHIIKENKDRDGESELQLDDLGETISNNQGAGLYSKAIANISEHQKTVCDTQEPFTSFAIQNPCENNQSKDINVLIDPLLQNTINKQTKQTQAKSVYDKALSPSQSVEGGDAGVDATQDKNNINTANDQTMISNITKKDDQTGNPTLQIIKPTDQEKTENKQKQTTTDTKESMIQQTDKLLSPEDKKAVISRQQQDYSRYKSFMDQNNSDPIADKNMENRTAPNRLKDSENFINDFISQNDVIIDIGSGLGHSDSRLQGITVSELVQNNNIKTKAQKIIASDIAEQKNSFKNQLGNDISIKWITETDGFNTPIAKWLEEEQINNPSGKTKLFLRSANAIDLLMNEQQTIEHLAHISEQSYDFEVYYMFNKHILHKDAKSNQFTIIGELNKAGFDHNSSDGNDWETEKERIPYLINND